MALRHRLLRLESRVGPDPGCPACRDRRGRVVFTASRRLPDGTTTEPEGVPARCTRCGIVPEFVIEVVERVIYAEEARALGQHDADYAARRFLSKSVRQKPAMSR